jgi:hypothetical protein
VEVRVYRARRKLAELLGADPSAKEGEG